MSDGATVVSEAQRGDAAEQAVDHSGEGGGLGGTEHPDALARQRRRPPDGVDVEHGGHERPQDVVGEVRVDAAEHATLGQRDERPGDLEASDRLALAEAVRHPAAAPHAGLRLRGEIGPPSLADGLGQGEEPLRQRCDGSLVGGPALVGLVAFEQLHRAVGSGEVATSGSAG